MENYLLGAVIACVVCIGLLVIWVRRLSKVEVPKPPSPHSQGYINRGDLDAAIEKAGKVLTLPQRHHLQNHLTKHGYLPESHIRVKFARKPTVAKMVAAEVAKMVSAAIAKLKPQVPEAITKVVEQPDAVTIPGVTTIQDVTTTPDFSAPVDPKYVEPDALEALKVVWLLLRYVHSLDAVIIAQLRVPLEKEVERLKEEVDEVLNPLEEALQDATNDLQDAESKRLKADISLREINREAEQHASEAIKLNPSMNEEAEFERYKSGRKALQIEHETEFEGADQKLKKAKKDLADFQEINKSKKRLDAANPELEKFEPIAAIVAELAKASDTSNNSIRPPAPATTQRKQRRALPKPRAVPKAKSARVPSLDELVRNSTTTTPPAPNPDPSTKEEDVSSIDPSNPPPDADFSMDSSPPEAGDGNTND